MDHFGLHFHTVANLILAFCMSRTGDSLTCAIQTSQGAAELGVFPEPQAGVI